MFQIKKRNSKIMLIQDMFADDINRKINGVIKVDQAADDVIEQELNEYVITRELKKHFITFFNYYGDAFDQPTADMGVWISGFFGSGKSHFLKMLSYLLENKEVKGIAENEEAHKALNTIRLITMVQTGSKFNYNRIRELNPLMDTVRTAHDKMLEEKRAEVLETVRQCMEATHTAANGDSKVSHLIEKSDRYFSQCNVACSKVQRKRYLLTVENIPVRFGSR